MIYQRHQEHTHTRTHTHTHNAMLDTATDKSGMELCLEKEVQAWADKVKKESYDPEC